MSNITISAIVGSLQKNSLNKNLYKAFHSSVPEDVTLNLIDIRELPLYNQDDEANFPATVKDFKFQVEAADGILLITPEHNRSFTAAMKNAIDWGSRPYGESSWNGKPVAITGATGGPIGTFGAQHHLRQILPTTNGIVMPSPELYFGNAYEKFDDHGEIVDPEIQAALTSFLEAFTLWIGNFKK